MGLVQNGTVAETGRPWTPEEDDAGPPVLHPCALLGAAGGPANPEISQGPP